VAHRVDAAVHDVQPAGLEAMADRTPSEAERRQLSARDDAVLRRRERGDVGVRRPSARFGPMVGLDLAVGGVPAGGPRRRRPPSRTAF